MCTLIDQVTWRRQMLSRDQETGAGNGREGVMSEKGITDGIRLDSSIEAVS